MFQEEILLDSWRASGWNLDTILSWNASGGPSGAFWEGLTAFGFRADSGPPARRCWRWTICGGVRHMKDMRSVKGSLCGSHGFGVYIHIWYILFIHQPKGNPYINLHEPNRLLGRLHKVSSGQWQVGDASYSTVTLGPLPYQRSIGDAETLSVLIIWNKNPKLWKMKA